MIERSKELPPIQGASEKQIAFAEHIRWVWLKQAEIELNEAAPEDVNAIRQGLEWLSRQKKARWWISNRNNRRLLEEAVNRGASKRGRRQRLFAADQQPKLFDL